MLIFYSAILITGLYVALKILLPEMAKPPLPNPVKPPSPKPVSKFEPKIEAKSNSFKLTAVVPQSENRAGQEPENRTEKLEALLTEKNKNILLLQSELKTFLVQIHEFDKVKVLLEEEIKHLKEQNQMFRSELGLPSTQIKENAIK